MKPTLLILAAGMGSRYGGLKQLDPVGPGGETIMDYSVFDAMRAGFDRVVFVIRHDFEELFKEQVGSKYAGQIAVGYAFQSIDDLPGGFQVPAGREKPWGTGQAVYAARDVVNAPFAAINADDFYGADGYRKLAAALSEPAPDEYCMCAFDMNKTLSENGTVSRGVCTVDADGYLETVVEHTKLLGIEGGVKSTLEDGSSVMFTGREPVSMNMWGFTPDLFDRLEKLFSGWLAKYGSEMKSEFYIPLVVSQLIDARQIRLKVCQSAAPWFGVTYREDKPGVVAAIRQLVDSGEYPEKLW